MNRRTSFGRMESRHGYALKIPFPKAFLKEFRMTAREAWRNDNWKPISEFLSHYFDTPEPKLVIDPACSPCYFHASKTIYIDKNSIVSFLHEWRHHWQLHHQKNLGCEIDAREFSVSLYACAFPRTYARMVEQDRLIYF